MSYTSIKCVGEDIAYLRNKHIESLPYPIELHMEWLVKNGQSYSIKNNLEEIVGYAIIADDCLLELYLLPYYVSQKRTIFHNLVTDCNLKSALVQSFDGLLLSCCVENSHPYTIIGTLFREFFDTPQFGENLYKKRIASLDDYEMLKQYNNGLYESEQELNFMLNNKMIYLYYLENQLVGCGFLIKIRPDKDWYDIGMWVDAPYRNKGIGTDIISDLKYHCLTNDYHPICGCAAENIASRKTLEKNGFITKHNLLQFMIK